MSRAQAPRGPLAAAGWRGYLALMPELGRGAIRVRRLRAADQGAFLGAVRRSRSLHRPWIFPPQSPAAFRSWLEHDDRKERYLVWLVEPAELVGYIGVNELSWGGFESGSLGYWADSRFAGKGLMRAGLELLVGHVFRRASCKLHRLEANIQPDNHASKALVQKVGFQLEGFSPRFLKVNGEWRDHERWALTREAFPTR